jgi:hypothetical protein
VGPGLVGPRLGPGLVGPTTGRVGAGLRTGDLDRAGRRASAAGCGSACAAAALALVVLLHRRERVLPVRAGMPGRLAARVTAASSAPPSTRPCPARSGFHRCSARSCLAHAQPCRPVRA